MNKKIKNTYLIVWLIMVVIFNVIVFVTPAVWNGYNKFGGAFWVGYIFIMLAFIGQLACTWYALKDESQQKIFYRIPIIKIGYTALIITIIVGILCMLIPNVPIWLGIIVCLIVVGFYTISVVKAGMAANIVEEIDRKISTDTMFIREMQIEAETIMNKTSTEESKKLAKNVYESIRYANAKTLHIESVEISEKEIREKVKEFRTFAETNSLQEMKKLSEEIDRLIKERDKKITMFRNDM